MLRLDAKGSPVIHGHTFRAIIYLYPEYSKRTTLAFLNSYVQRGGSLMMEGAATRDFEGKPIADLFAPIQAKARVNGFNIDDMEKLGVSKDPLRAIGGALEDGSVILTDLPSLQKDQPESFDITVGGHHFTGTFEGVFAIKVSGQGTIQKLACGECGILSRDGLQLLSLKSPADLVVLSDGKGGYNAVVSGAPGSNAIHLKR